MKSFLLFISVTFVVQNIFAFTLISSSMSNMEGWDTKELKFDINTSNCPSDVNIEGLIEDAVKVWNQVPTSNLKLKAGSSSTSTTFSNPPVVVCSPNFETDTGGADGDFVIAAANVTISNYKINSGIIRINVQTGKLGHISNIDKTTATIVLAHEIGHILGLGHTEDTSALMYYDASAKESLALSQDDVDGITYLYPRNELSGDQMMGCGTIHKSAPPPSSKPWILLCLLVPILVWAQNRRKFLRPNMLS